jgi:S-adenosylmethionine:tRNA ribosyltransferase-isomerase
MVALLESPRESLVDFALPADLEARVPPEARGLARDEVRLLVSERETGEIAHDRFYDLPKYLRSGDLVVVNDSATIPAALSARRENGAEIDLHLSTMLPTGAWVVEPRKVRTQVGERLELPGGAHAQLIAPYRASVRLWVARLCLPGTVYQYLAQHGRPITYSYIDGDWPIEMYQTAYARHPGSAEMPSAGRAFSERVIARLRERDIGWATLTLHTGVASLEGDEMPYEEWFHVPAATAEAVNRTRTDGGRVIAVGTTVVRSLESAVDRDGIVHPSRGWTGLVVTPQRGVRAVDALLTGFHEPKASHLWMLEAIAGADHLQAAYAAALDGRYLWHEFGDLHLIL